MAQQEGDGLEGSLKALQKANQALLKEKLALQAEICTLQKAAKMAIPKEESEVKIKVSVGRGRANRIYVGIKSRPWERLM